jgi:hypothetical protein
MERRSNDRETPRFKDSHPIIRAISSGALNRLSRDMRNQISLRSDPSTVDPGKGAP